jgi:hypothetical protein
MLSVDPHGDAVVAALGGAVEPVIFLVDQNKKTRIGTAFWLVAKCCHRRGGMFGVDQSKAVVRNSCGIRASPSPPGLLSPRRGEEGYLITVPTLIAISRR